MIATVSWPSVGITVAAVLVFVGVALGSSAAAADRESALQFGQPVPAPWQVPFWVSWVALAIGCLAFVALLVWARIL